MKELHKGAIFCSLVGQDIGEFMAEILHQASLRDMLENHIGNEGDICGEEKAESEKLVNGQRSFYITAFLFGAQTDNVGLIL